MSLDNVVVLPHLARHNGQVSIPPPPDKDFNKLFGGILPPAQKVNSYWGTTTYYLIRPSHPSPPASETPRRVVLIHGACTPCVGLVPLATLLAASSTPTTVLIYDIWGHGLSSSPVATHVPGLFHTQILHLLSHLQWPSAHVLGYSFGGAIAASFAACHASVVDSLILVAPGGLLRKSNLSAWTRFVLWGGWGWGWEGISARMIYRQIGPGPVPGQTEEGWEKKFKETGVDAVPREAIQDWTRENHSGHIASLISAYRYGGLYDSQHMYRSIAKGNIETMVLLGEHDDLFQEEYMRKELEMLAWRGEVHVMNGVGHRIIADKSNEVQNLALAFWDGLQRT